MLGTGCRIGEGLGLRWEDIDFEKSLISINHSLTYYPISEDRTTEFHIHKPKTDAGIRTIPLLDSVRDALDILREEEDSNGSNEQEVDGYSGFIFQNRFGTLPNPASVNRTIKRIVNSYNADERLNAAREGREPLMLPEFSCHHLRHPYVKQKTKKFAITFGTGTERCRSHRPYPSEPLNGVMFAAVFSKISRTA